MGVGKNRILIFLASFAAINLAFIPLLSLYGLRVCPVLSIPGFGFGCYYSGLYVAFILILNSAMLAYLGFADTVKGFAAVLSRHMFWSMTGVYILSTAGALILLQFLLRMNHLTTHSRAPEILAFASLLLGVTQSYGTIWAFHHANVWRPTQNKNSFRKNWMIHVGRTMLPILIVAGILLHFLIGQSVSFNEGKTAPIIPPDEMIRQTSYLIYFLLSWLAITFTFHFLSERDQVAATQKHLNKLGESLDTKFRSETSGAWGLWCSILENLNLFSQALGERTRLLSAFSKFVSAGVAKDVLKTEALSTEGINQEMTVLMIDVRNFTSLSESLRPGQVVALLNEYFSAMLSVVAQLPLAVDKFIGDGILAYVENSASGEQENRTAVEAALKMLGSLPTLNQRLNTLALPSINIGIGIYRGPLVLGLIGTETKLQHTIIGDTVNRAARLESLSKELGVPSCWRERCGAV